MYIRSCPNCKKEIIHKNYISFKRAIGNQLICVSCAAKKRSLLKQKTLIRKCPNCNNDIHYKRHDALLRAERKNSPCSKCYRIGMSPQGKENLRNALYKRWGTTKKGNLTVYFTKGQLLSWKRKVKIKDDYTCQYCGSKESLDAHHILCKSKHPELALSLYNGITLCIDCHRVEHAINGLI